MAIRRSSHSTVESSRHQNASPRKTDKGSLGQFLAQLMAFSVKNLCGVFIFIKSFRMSTSVYIMKRRSLLNCAQGR